MKKAILSTVIAMTAVGGITTASTAHAEGSFPPPFDFYDTPQMGAEPVRGSGCGGDGSIGDVIPDGYWRGYMTSLDEVGGTLEFDLVCVYFTPQDSTIEVVPDGYLSNNKTRTCTVPIAPAFFSQGSAFQPDGSVPFDQVQSDADGDGIPDAPPFEGTDAWLFIDNGQAQWLIGSPVADGQPVTPQPPLQVPGPIDYASPLLWGFEQNWAYEMEPYDLTNDVQALTNLTGWQWNEDMLIALGASFCNDAWEWAPSEDGYNGLSEYGRQTWAESIAPVLGIDVAAARLAIDASFELGTVGAHQWICQ